MDVFVDPVMCSDGHTYERSAIENWFQANTTSATSPMTNERLESRGLLPNITLRKAIAEWRLEYVADTDSDYDVSTSAVCI